MSLSFEIFSRLMVVAAIAIVAVPLVSKSPKGRVWISVGASALFIYLGSALAYPYLSNWHWPAAGSAPVSASAPAGQPDLAALQAQTRATPDEPGAWAQLATAYLEAQQPAAAVAPLERVYELTGGANIEWSLLLVDALMMSDDGARERVNQLVETMLAQTPDHPKALYYGAELAFSRNDLELARARWQRLLLRAQQEDSDEARNVRDVLAKRIALVDERLGDAPEAPAEAVATTGPAITVQVSLPAERAGQVAPTDPVFILARDGPGPPVAVVRRQVADLPLTVTLTDANAMLPARKLSNFDQVEIVARVARGGSPVAQSGDVSGRAMVATSRVEPVRIILGDIEP